jgi:hypothetical protein
LKKANIFYIFPDGCQASQINTSDNFRSLDDEIVETPAEANINEQIYDSVTESNEETTKESTEETTEETTTEPITVEPTTIETYISNFDECADACCDKKQIQIVFPEQGSCCKNLSALIIPLDLSELENIPITEIAELSNELDPVKLLLKLLRVLEKCRN